MTDPKQPEPEEVLKGIEVEEPELLEPLAVPPREQPSTDLEIRPPGNEVLMPLDTELVVQGMQAYQALLPKLLDASDWQQAGSEKFVKKSGWRKIARAFNLSVMVVSVRIERDEDGNPTRAETIARAMGPNGQISDADGYCSADEKRFLSTKGKQKIENDLRATATTRAKNRAISDLVGMGEVSAEEVELGGGGGLPEATPEQNKAFSQALMVLMPEAAARDLYGQLRASTGGTLYGAVADAVCAVVRAHQEVRDAESDERAGQKQAEKEAGGG